jgi:UDP-2,3-diacylglucosamine pyrophosphatase LpxH
MKIIKYIIGLSAKGVRTYYITGNHDETLRKFNGFKIGKLEILNQLVLTINGKETWFFHGDVFDVLMQNSKWLLKLGAIGYDSLIWLNVQINRINKLFGKGNVSLSKRIKENVKTAVKYINNFEETAAHFAVKKKINYIVCGHIHQAESRIIEVANEKIFYLNSGDWVENLTSLEFNNGKWCIYRYEDDTKIQSASSTAYEKAPEDYNNKELFDKMLKEFQN